MDLTLHLQKLYCKQIVHLRVLLKLTTVPPAYVLTKDKSIRMVVPRSMSGQKVQNSQNAILAIPSDPKPKLTL